MRHLIAIESIVEPLLQHHDSKNISDIQQNESILTDYKIPAVRQIWLNESSNVLEFSNRSMKFLTLQEKHTFCIPEFRRIIPNK